MGLWILSPSRAEAAQGQGVRALCTCYIMAIPAGRGIPNPPLSLGDPPQGPAPPPGPSLPALFPCSLYSCFSPQTLLTQAGGSQTPLVPAPTQKGSEAGRSALEMDVGRGTRREPLFPKQEE